MIGDRLRPPRAAPGSSLSILAASLVFRCAGGLLRTCMMVQDSLANIALAGAMSGVINDVVTHPMDTLRAKLQTARSSTLSTHPLTAMRAMAAATVATEGLAGLYRGVSSVGLFSAPAYALYFGSYKAVAARIEESWEKSSGATAPAYMYFLAGLAAEGASNVLYIPYDAIKQRLQCAPIGTNLNALSLSIAVVRAEGILGLYPGVLATILSYGPFSGIYFAVYEGLRRMFVSDVPGVQSSGAVLGCAISAGSVAAIVTQPIDVIRTRIQVGVHNGEGPPSVPSVMRNILQKEGHAVLLRGTLARVLSLAPGCGFTMMMFEGFLRRLSRRDLANEVGPIMPSSAAQSQ